MDMRTVRNQHQAGRTRKHSENWDKQSGGKTNKGGSQRTSPDSRTLIRVQRHRGLIENEVHGATFQTLADNSVSNMMMKNAFAKNSNAFFRFVIAPRTDNLPTPANIKRWYQTEGERCGRCGEETVPTLAHILNKCTPGMVKMTEIHNALSGLIKKALMKQMGAKITNGVFDNVTVPIEGLSKEVSRKKPGLWFISNIEGKCRLELVEFTCPYGYISQPDDQRNKMHSLEEAYRKKHAKYTRIAEEIQEKELP
jgi:hypothetical protein